MFFSKNNYNKDFVRRNTHTNSNSNTQTNSSPVTTGMEWWRQTITLMSTIYQGRNMVYPGPIDPYFLDVILIPEPHFPQNFDPWALIKKKKKKKKIDPIHAFTQNFNLDNFVYLLSISKYTI